MASFARVISGLQILERNLGKPGTGNVEAEHDEIFASGLEPSKLSDEDRAALDALRWRWNEELECWALFT